jgi:carbon monoxide dehydrogenase subunit G
MELESSFSVVAPIDVVWKVLMDFDRVASAVPGAEILNRLSDDALQVGMKVKLGPVTLQYKGLVNIKEIDVSAHRAVFDGKAQETRGQGTVDGSATLALSETDGTTTGSVHAELSLSGKAASMGKSIINSVTEQMVGLFAKNLQAMVLEDLGSGSGGAASENAPPAGSAVKSESVKSESAEKSAEKSPLPDNSLNAFSLAKGVVADQLRNPAKLVGLLAVVGAIGFLIGCAFGRDRGTRRG